MERFAAIDFETANGKRSSICSIGIAILEDDWVVDSIYTLVRPTPNFYTRWTTAIHGLSAEDTNDALCFEEAWESIAPKLKDLPLVAHIALTMMREKEVDTLEALMASCYSR